MPVTKNAVAVNVTTEEPKNSEMSTGTLTALSMGGGGALGGLGGGAIGGAIGGALIGVASGGIGLLIGGVVGGIVTLSIWLSKKPQYTAEQLNEIKEDEEKLIELEQQPAIIVEAVISNINEHVSAVVMQTSEQNTCIDSAVITFTDTVAIACNTTTTLSNVAQSMQQSADNAVSNVQIMEKELSLARKKFDKVTIALQQTQQSLSDTEAQLRETSDKLSTTQDQLATTSSAAQNQLTQLLEQQRRIGETLKQAKPETIQIAEIETMKKQIRNLSSKNKILGETIQTLSEKIMIVIEDNHALRDENSKLKRTITFFSHAPVKQSVQAQANPESSNATTDTPSILRERAHTN